MKHLDRQENKLLNKPESSLMKTTITPMKEKIEGLIPKQLKSTLNAAFYKGFQLIFEKGNAYIEKTYDKEKLSLDFDVNNYALDKKLNQRHMRRLDKASTQSRLVNTSFSVAEGGILGFLGVGIPDIPLFLAVIIRTLNEIALSYGFNYETEEEKTYTLLLICGAISKGEKQKEYNRKVEELGNQIDLDIVDDINFDEQMRITSDLFSETLLTAKFIQGIPVVGAIGGVVNYNIINKISSYARIKYKKRYLGKKLSS
ncbi:MAG TPA: EcsC family protein [Clostridiales bacterium]|nr:EcsC family protein [Clostridiales bacterium]